MPVTAPPLKATSSAFDTPPRALSATRALARTDTFMPMKPAAAEKVPPIRKPMAIRMPSDPCASSAIGEHDRQDHGYAADDRVLAAQIGRGAFLHGARDALHLVVAGREREQPARGHDAVHHGHGRANKRDDHAVVSQEIQKSVSSV